MAGDLPSRLPSGTLEGPNFQGSNLGTAANPGDVAGGSNIAEPQVPRRNGNDPMLSKDPTY